MFLWHNFVFGTTHVAYQHMLLKSEPLVRTTLAILLMYVVHPALKTECVVYGLLFPTEPTVRSQIFHFFLLSVLLNSLYNMSVTAIHSLHRLD
jgi:hypothetical protein